MSKCHNNYCDIYVCHVNKCHDIMTHIFGKRTMLVLQN